MLKEAAFLLKTYIISIEKGIFLTQFDASEEEELPQYTPRFALRLKFNTSPYPPRGEWREPDRAPGAFKFWELNQFCCRQIGSF